MFDFGLHFASLFFMSSLSASFHRSLSVDISTYKMFNTLKCPKAAKNVACVYFLLWQNVWENLLSQSFLFSW